ncbi:MAG TPA: immunoglobulin-like domain-containing protein, partial [Candidatus Paceibacterota bacterium]|nr:immunoglobulin-like domain-containing protein [Candidatus Paceibacterota bacterium]
GNGSGGFANAAAGTDYENPLTFTYPLTRSTNTVSLAFGTTTSNTWSALQQFANASTSQLSAGVASFGATATSTFAANGSLTLPSGAALTLTGNTSHLLRTDGSGTVSSVTIGTGLSFDGATLIATSGGGGSVATSSAETAGQLAYWTTTAGTPATLGTIATSSVALASPLSYSGTLGALVGGAGGTLSIANAKADGSTVGAATFSTSGFNDNGSGLISLDYANGQKADGAQPGYLASSDWTLFNNKISSTSLSASYPLSYNSATGAFIFTGLSTSTVPVVGNIPYYSGANTFANVATSSAVLGSEFSYSGTLGALVGGAGGTLHITGGGVTNAMLQNSTISGVALGNALGALTATNGTLTFSGSYNGSAAQTVGLNLGSANAWSALQQFGGGLTAYASSTIGNGSTTGGLTVNGNATTTGSVYAAGTLAVGTNVPADLITASNPSGGGITVIDTGTNGATWSVDTTDDAWCAKGSKLIFLANEGNSCDATLTLLTSGSVGIGTTTPTAALSVVGEGSSGDALTVANTDTTGWSDVALLDANGAQQATLAYANAGSSVYADSLVFESNAKNIIFGTGLGSNERMRITAGGNIGIGTTSPGSLLSVGDTGGINFGTATSTFSTTGGINLASGCFAINGTCISGGVVGGSGTVGSGSTGQFPYYAGGGTTLTATSSLFLAASGNIGIGTTSPIGKFAIQTAVNQAGAFTISNAIGSTTLQFDTLDNSTSIFTVATSTGTAYFNVGASGTITISGLAAAAGAFIAADPSGNLIATTTPGGSGGVGSGTIGQLPYYAANGTTLTATSSLFLAASGNIGIGTTSPYARLSVMAGGDYASHAVSTLFAISSSSAGTATSTLFSVDSTGLTTVGDSSGTGDAVFQFAADSNAWAVGYKSSDKSFNIASSTNLSGTAALSIAKNGNATFSGSGGTCVINGSGACTSDERLKSDIKDISGSDALAKLALISGITYTWADPSLDQSQRVGVLAQQVLSAFPQLVGSTTVNFKGTPGNYYTVDYAGLTAPLISAVNQLNGVYDAGGASTTQPTLRSFYHGAALPALSVDAVGNVAIATTTSAYRLAIAGSAYAESYAAPQGLWTGYLSSMGLGTTTVGSAPPSAVLTANGAVDVYKLAAYNAGSIAALASRIALDETRITSLESRVTALENGTVSDGGFSSSTLADALQSVGAFIQNGIAQFGTLVADRFVAASDSAGNSSAGSSAVLAGNTVVEVDNVYAHPDSKILVTFTSPISGGWYLSQKNEGSFRVTLNQPQLYDSTFDYFIIETSGQIATSTAPVGEEASSTSQRLPAGEEASSMPPAPPAPPADEEEASSTPPAGGDDEASSTPVLPPTIALIGAAAMQLSVGDSWSDPGATATASDGVTDLTSAIVETGAVDTATPALYILTYAVTDPDGASAQVSRAVSVLAPAPTAQNAATSTPSTDEGVASSTAPADTASSAAP